MQAMEYGRVTFTCIGAGKAGTTWLWSALRGHPDVFLPEIKELHYFSREAFEDPSIRNPNFDKPISWYHRFFQPAQPDQLCGDFSPSYLFGSDAAERIAAYNAKMKIIVLLRDPVERTFSHYLFAQQRGLFKNLSFEAALEQLPFIADQSEYGRLLTPYFRLFPRQQICVLQFEQLKRDPAALLATVEEFLGIRQWSDPASMQPTNETGIPRYPGLNRFLTRARVFMKKHRITYVQDLGHAIGLGRLARFIRGQVSPYRSDRPRLAPETEQRLRLRFHADMDRLEALTGLDCSAWRETPDRQSAKTCV